MQAFDFDEWAKLYEKSPAEFEARRKATLEEMISASPLGDAAKSGLREALFAPVPAGQDPMESVVRAQKLMWDAFSDLQAQLKTLHVSANQDGTVSLRKSAVAQFTV